MKFLAARYQKGKEWINDFMSKSHQYINVGPCDGHRELLSFFRTNQSTPDACLVSHL